MAAHAPKHGRSRKPPEAIWVEGEDELHALTLLVLALRELDRPGRMAELERLMRLAYYRGAQDASYEPTGRPMPADVQERVIERFPD